MLKYEIRKRAPWSATLYLIEEYGAYEMVSYFRVAKKSGRLQIYSEIPKTWNYINGYKPEDLEKL